MSTSGVVNRRRWWLPARRRRFVSVAAPAVFATVFFALLFAGDWWQSLGLAMTLSGLLWLLSVGFVRLESDLGTPDRRRPHYIRRDKRRLIEVVRQGLPLAEDVATWMRPMAEQIGLQSARGLLMLPSYVLVFGGMVVGKPLTWWTAIPALAVVFMLIAGILMLRDRNACAAFLDRYGELQPRA